MKKIAIHSYRGGTGKSSISANLAALLAQDGKRVGVIDTDIQSPGINVLFGIGDLGGNTLNDYLWGDCSIKNAVVDVTARTGLRSPSALFLLPASFELGKLTRILKEGYDVGILNKGFNEFADAFSLDFLLIDTHPGLNEETLLSLAVSDISFIVLRPDNQDYLGTSITVDVARKLDVADMRLVLNMLPSAFDEAQVREKVESTYSCSLAAIFGNYEDVRCMASSGLLALDKPDGDFARRVRTLALAVTG